MARAEAVANGEEILWSHHELSQHLLGRKVVLQEMSSLRFLQVLETHLTTTDLYGVVPVLLDSLHLSNLAPIDLYDGARYNLTPLVPEVSHPYLVSEQTRSLALAILWGCLRYLILRVELILKRCECLSLIRLSMSRWGGKGIVVKNLPLIEVLIPDLVQLRNRELLLRGCCGKESCGLGENYGPQKHCPPATIECLVDDLRQHI